MLRYFYRINTSFFLGSTLPERQKTIHSSKLLILKAVILSPQISSQLVRLPGTTVKADLLRPLLSLREQFSLTQPGVFSASGQAEWLHKKRAMLSRDSRSSCPESKVHDRPEQTVLKATSHDNDWAMDRGAIAWERAFLSQIKNPLKRHRNNGFKVLQEWALIRTKVWIRSNGKMANAYSMD